jgi:hypothetical protein
VPYSLTCSRAVGAFLIDVFPSLRHIPPGFPGGGFHALAAKWAKAFNDMVEVPYAYAKEMIVSQSHSEYLTLGPYIKLST